MGKGRQEMAGVVVEKNFGRAGDVEAVQRLRSRRVKRGGVKMQ